MRVWKRLLSFFVVLCAIAVPVCWLAIRLQTTYLPDSTDEMPIGDRDVDQTVAPVKLDSYDLPGLEASVQRTAKAVLPSVVAVRNPVAKPTELAGYQRNYASGVIVTSDGIVLSQWHVSHANDSEGDHESTSWDRLPPFVAGDRTTVILHDGRECPAELLGANRTYDLSLLRLLEPGPYPHVPIGAAAGVKIGDWVLKIGHPVGFRKGRSAPVRLGRVICGAEEMFGTDCMWCGGDSGGPYFSLDGQLLGIIRHAPLSSSAPTWLVTLDARLFRRSGGFMMASVTGTRLIDSVFDAMQSGEVTPYDMEESVRIDLALAGSARQQPADFSQGSASLARYRGIVKSARSSVVVVLNAGVAVSLGTIVDAEGLVVTKASELPGEPSCRLPDGRVLSARVLGIDSANDLALLELPTKGLQPVQWAEDFNPPAGTFLAAVGPDEVPLAIGVVSVARRDLDAPARPLDSLPLRIAAGRPEIYGRAEPVPGYSLRAAFGRPRPTAYRVGNVTGLAWSAGIRPGDLLLSISGREIQTEEDIRESVNNQRTGDLVPVRLRRAGRRLELQLPLAPEPRLPDHSYRSDDFSTAIECAVPFYAYECGGPIVDLTGRAIGITISRIALHGGMAIPGDCVLESLKNMRAGQLAETWTAGGH